MKSKKLLAPMEMGNPNKIIKGYLYPNSSPSNKPCFYDTYNQKEWQVGMVVFLGKEISTEELFAKIIDKGAKIDSVENLMASLDNYLEQLQNFKIGDFVGIVNSSHSFDLIKLQKS